MSEAITPIEKSGSDFSWKKSFRDLPMKKFALAKSDVELPDLKAVLEDGTKKFEALKKSGKRHEADECRRKYNDLLAQLHMASQMFESVSRAIQLGFKESTRADWDRGVWVYEQSMRLASEIEKQYRQGSVDITVEGAGHTPPNDLDTKA
ncbi:hypothetical protein A3A40_00050 [Candidatus Kaiserbacteria bacterium RIFCSPLOWO2_01_FULL_54_20]|uniref:Uncharacterized protein n=1 Tax=Candidatus Kaiserbacteria bacterium RIFCSPLOWO2_01_FULL_54_20 TaxID=1798513 RepID=A0A1F6EIS0_9BACT|nr:MAG: hypothetical protein A3A40_00050 [Candidatus Kaiserbacteria bacterium RIFCSPLOWO2_01_FULL_54_20]